MADEEQKAEGSVLNLLSNYWRDGSGHYHEKNIEYYVTQGTHGQIVYGKVSRDTEDD